MDRSKKGLAGDCVGGNAAKQAHITACGRDDGESWYASWMKEQKGSCELRRKMEGEEGLAGRARVWSNSVELK